MDQAKKRIKPVIEEVPEVNKSAENTKGSDIESMPPLASDPPAPPAAPSSETPPPPFVPEENTLPVESVGSEVEVLPKEEKKERKSPWSPWLGKGSAAVENVEPVQEEVDLSGDDPGGKTSLKMILVITVLSALVAAFVSGGVYVYLSSADKSKETPSMEESESSEPVERVDEESGNEEVEEEPVDISSLSVQVLNGVGRAGAAGDAEDVLVDAGFVVGATGNADNFNYTSTVVRTKSTIPTSVLNTVVESLEGADYTVETGENLETTSEYDIVVVVGAN